MTSELRPSKKSDSSTEPATSNSTVAPQSSLKYGPNNEDKKMEDLASLKGSSPAGEVSSSMPSTQLLEVDLNQDRRKRRKTDSPKAKDSPVCDHDHTFPPLSGSQGFQKAKSGTTTGTNGAETLFSDQEPQGEREGTDNDRPSSVSTPISAEAHQALENCAMGMANDTATSSGGGELYPAVDGGAAMTPKQGPDAMQAVANEGESKPKKLLRLNPKTGTIGSPPSKKKEPEVEPVHKPARARRQKQPSSKVVAVHYGVGTNLPAEIGPKIGQILDGTETATSFTSKGSTQNNKPLSRKVTGANPGAAPHPFFLGKPAVKTSAAQPPTTSTPEDKGTSRSQESTTLYLTGPRLLKRPINKASVSTFSSFGGFGANTTKILKFPGAAEPAWPWKGMTHIRGANESLVGFLQPSNSMSSLPSRSKKSKNQAVEVLAAEDVIDRLATDLCVPSIVKSLKDVNVDEYPPLPECLRTPTRHFSTGPRLQKQVQKELFAPLSPPAANDEESASEDEIQGTGHKKTHIHPALANLYDALASSLSAFDQSRCETQSWALKYSPKAAAEVLQTGRQAMILKEWLQTLTVQSVETGAGDHSHSRASSVSRRLAVPGKRKQKSKKLEGFVVSSDEEDGDMTEISEPEDDATPRGSQGAKRTVVRTSNADTKSSGRLTNAVVVSGPHGCGKTAAVYAAAKELGFEIFEINSSSRRSGKDILEKVGDMTHNHLVQSAQKEVPTDPVDEDAKRIADALESDIQSGRQGTMNSFFKPKDSTKAKPKAKKSETATSKTESKKTSAIAKAPPKQQKQSLILFEEVDILYEEDKQFWATVIAMIVQSKRPIIMTCTDESAVPLDSLTLHAIVRLTSPPVDLATDYLLLVAANEGHLLCREAVKLLYESRQLDLRASLMELNFWCQFAVGDVRGGLEWLYPRWPPSSDLDENEHTIRVISEGTYETGMGWLSQDFLESHQPYLDIEEETLHEAWDGWHLDIGDCEKRLDIAAWATRMHAQSKGKRDQAATVSIYGDYLDAMSAADVCAGGAFAPYNKVSLIWHYVSYNIMSNCHQVQLDSSLPKLSSKVREDYILAYELLEGSPLVTYDSIGLDVSLWMKSRARKYLQIDQHTKLGFEVPPELDRPSEAQIIELIRNESCSPEFSLSRQDFSLAFDPISEPEKTSLHSTGSLEASSFDRNLSLITLDIAPYVRSIVAYDARLQQDRSRLSGLLSEGGRRGKRMRTTRSAMSALEGGARSTTRRDRYFGPGLNPHFVLRTGTQSWLDAMLADMKGMGREGSNEIGSGVDEVTGGEDSQ